MSEPWGAYVHVPWCRLQCPYCAFAVQTGAAPPSSGRWARAVLDEFAARRDAFSGGPSTLFFGGGTPSRVDPETLASIVAAVGATDEVSAEANPEDLSPAWLDGALEAGIERLSVGVQSFDASVRKRLGRAWVDADPEVVLQRVARAGFSSWSVDLIFAAPDQTLEQLDRDLDHIEALQVPHVALYGLTIEPDTPFAVAHGRGQLLMPRDDLWRTMYDHIVERLRRAGLERYELSNFARPGHSCRHNQGYWQDRPYLGLGPSSHSYLPDGTRTTNHVRLGAYLAAEDPVADVEHPSAHERYVDALVSGLRATDGVDLERLAAHTGLKPADDAVDRMVAEGLAARRGTSLFLTDQGMPLCDAAVAHLADRGQPAK